MASWFNYSKDDLTDSQVTALIFFWWDFMLVWLFPAGHIKNLHECDEQRVAVPVDVLLHSRHRGAVLCFKREKAKQTKWPGAHSSESI